MDTPKEVSNACPVGRGLAIVGDAWSMLILRDAGLGLARFDQFRASLGIAPNILTRRLRTLTEEGLLEKRRYSARPPRDEYLLTDAGRDFLPVLQVIGAWGRKHRGAGRLSHMEDAATGRTIAPLVVDAVSGKPIAELELRLVPPA